MSICVTEVAAILPKCNEADVQTSLGDVMDGKCRVKPLENAWQRFGLVRLGSAFDGSTIDESDLPPQMVQILDTTCKYAVMVGLNALQKAGLVSPDSAEPWVLPESAQDRTGIIFTSSYSHHENALSEVSRYAEHRLLHQVQAVLEKNGIHQSVLNEINTLQPAQCRKLALQLTLRANTQLAQIIKARGPNTYCSNACASTSAAIHLAVNVLKLEDADRMIVISADAPLSCDGHGALVDSFAYLGAASSASDVTEALRPFSTGRNGFVFGEGAIALLLESDRVEKVSCVQSLPSRTANNVHVLTCKSGNSAHHGTRMHSKHIASVIAAAVKDVCAQRGITISEFCSHCLYVSHDTFTQICADAEVEALEAVFGRRDLTKITITNSKATTGHTMGVCIEDVVAILALQQNRAPRISMAHIEPKFSDLNFSSGKEQRFDFSIHLACGIGSHVVVVIYGKSHMDNI